MALKCLGEREAHEGAPIVFAIDSLPLELELYDEHFGIGYPTTITDYKRALETFRWIAEQERPRRKKPISFLDHSARCLPYVRHSLDINPATIPEDVKEIYFHLYRQHYLWCSGTRKAISYQKPPSLHLVSKRVKLPPYFIELVKKTATEDIANANLLSGLEEFQRELSTGKGGF